MSIKCALLGDTHLNVPKRTDEARRVAEWIRDDAAERGVDLFGLAGDVMDGPMTELDRLWLQGFLRSCADIAPVVVVSGNHDARYSLRQFASRSDAPHLETKYPIIVEDGAGVHTVETFNGEIAVAGVAFPWRSEILARIGHKGVEDADNIAQEALRTVFLGLGVRVRELGLPTLALVHGAIRGSKINPEQPDRPLGLELPVEDLAQIGCDFGVVGHVHLAQGFQFNGVEFVTPSAPFYTDYGEAKHPKGYIWAEFHPPLKGLGVLINGDETTSLDMAKVGKRVSWERIPTPVTPMILAEAKWMDGSFVGDGERRITPDIVAGSDVRFRFHYAKEHEKAAKAAADEYVESLKRAGAVNVTLDPVQDIISRARIPGLATAVRLEDKLKLYRESMDAVPSETETAALDFMLNEVREELAAKGLSMGTEGRTAPSLQKVTGRGFLKFPNEFDFDLRELGQLTAIVAPNEAGKTLLMQLMGPGCLFGETFTRGTLNDLAIAKDSFIETEFLMNGARYTLGQTITGARKTKTGAVNLLKDGQPVLAKAGREEYSQWSSKNLLPWEVYGALICQSGTKGVIDLSDGERTKLITRVLGIEYYEAVAEACRKKATAVAAELERVNARLGELGQDDLEHLSEVVSDYRQALDMNRGNLVTAEEELAQQRARATAIEKQHTERDALIRQQADLQGQEQRLREKIADIDTRLANNQEVVNQAEAIRDAHVEADSLRQQLENCQERDRALRIAGSKIESILDLANQEHRSQTLIRERLIKDIAETNAIYATKTAVQATIDSIPDFEAAVRECVEDRDGAFKEYEEVQTQAVAGKDERITGLRTGLEHIRDGEEPSLGPAIADSTLTEDDRARQMADDHPSLLAQAKAAWQQRDLRAAEALQQLERLRREADKMSEVTAAGVRVAELEEQVRKCDTELETVSLRVEEKQKERENVRGWIEANDKCAIRVSAELAELKPLADKLGVLESAEVRITELTQQRKDLQYDLDGVIDRLGRLVIPDAEPSLDLRPYEEAVSSERRAIVQCQSGLAVAEKALADAQAKAQRVIELQAEASGLRISLDRWNRLARELGGDGLPKEEISNAGPRLTDLVNDLLRTAGDTRHTVSIQTERLHSNRKQMIPCLDILVFDSEEQITKESRRLSDAGKILVGEPFSLALVILGCERAGIKSPTIFRDEATGVMDTVNAPRYIGMLRRFADILEAQVLFISQQPAIQDLADNQIQILEGGKIVVT